MARFNPLGIWVISSGGKIPAKEENRTLKEDGDTRKATLELRCDKNRKRY